MGLFDKLSGSLQKVFRDMRGYGKLSEQNVFATPTGLNPPAQGWPSAAYPGIVRRTQFIFNSPQP